MVWGVGLGLVWFWGFWGDFCFVFCFFGVFRFTDNSPETKNRKRLIITHEFLLQSHFIGPKTFLSRSTFWSLCPMDSLRHFANSSSLFPAPPRDLKVHFQGQHTSTELYRNFGYRRLFTDLPTPCTDRSHARDRSQCELCEM